MAEFEHLSEVTEGLRGNQRDEDKDKRKRVIKLSNDLNDMLEETVETFKALHPDVWIAFEDKMAERKSRANVYGEPTLATAEEKAMELRLEVMLPVAVIETPGLNGRVNRSFRDLRGVLRSIYRKHGFEDFPNAQNKTEFKMLKDFYRDFPVFCVAEKI